MQCVILHVELALMQAYALSCTLSFVHSGAVLVLFMSPIQVIRIFNTYGPHMHPYDGRVVSNFIRQVPSTLCTQAGALCTVHRGSEQVPSTLCAQPSTLCMRHLVAPTVHAFHSSNQIPMRGTRH